MESVLLQIKQKTLFQKKPQTCRSQFWEPAVVTSFGNYFYSQITTVLHCFKMTEIIQDFGLSQRLNLNVSSLNCRVVYCEFVVRP